MTWDLSKYTFSEKQLQLATEFHAWLVSQQSSLATAIVGLNGGAFADQDMRMLEQAIIEHFKPLASAADILKVLCKVVDIINHHAVVPLPKPLIPNLRVRPKNPFKEDVSTCLGRVRIWRASFDHYVSKLPQWSSKKEQFGRLLISTILRGGLLDASLLVALVQSLTKPPNRFGLYHGRLSVELSIAWQGESGSEYRIWYPDAFTSTLIAKLPDDLVLNLLAEESVSAENDSEIRKLIWQCIVTYFKASTLKSTDKPRSLRDLLNCVHLDLQTRLPMVLTHYAARNLVSHSPNKIVIARLLGDPILSLSNQEDPLQKTNTKHSASGNVISDHLDDIEPYWLADLRKVFRNTVRKELTNQLHLMSQKWPVATIEFLFVDFAYHLVASKSDSGNLLAINTAKSYLITVAKRLGGRLGGVNPKTLNVETLENLYVEILEDADETSGAKKQRRNIARALREFHHYLETKYGFEKLNAREVLGIGKGLVPVDANLIQVEEYEQIYSCIPQIIKDDHPTITAQDKLSTAAQLIFMLAFRCGLRRMEVLKLNVDDFKDASPAELLIRPTDARRLKTKSSTRKIPLYALLTPNELNELRKWKARRAEEIANKTLHHEKFLFGIPELNFEFIPQDTLFPIIHRAMRTVTQDSTLRFHHLRHSFATWSFMRLMLADLRTIPVLFPNQPKTQQYLEESKIFRKKLYGQNTPTRKHVYAVASLLGHSGPEISMEHYVHCCDVMLSVWLNEDLSAPSPQTVRLQSGRPQSTSYRWTKTGTYHTPFRLLKKRWPMLLSKPNKQFCSAQASNALPLLSGQQVSVDNQLFQKMYKLLYQHGYHGDSIDDLAIAASYSEVFVQSVLQQMNQIRDLQVGRGSNGYRHRMIEVALDRRKKDQITRLACPIAPHTSKDEAILELLAPKFLMAMKTKPDLCRRVFQYYLHHAWQTRNYLVFKDLKLAPEAIEFIEFLELIGLKKSSLRFVSFDTSLRSSHLASWKEMLGLTSRHNILKLPPPRISNTSAKAWLGMYPIFSDEKNENSGEETGSIAFRFLMVLAAAILFSLP